MSGYQVRLLTPDDVAQVVLLQQAYARLYPGAPVIPGAVYLSPAFEGGRTVLCAFDEAGCLAGYAPLYLTFVERPGPEPHSFWAEVKADPALPDPLPLKDLLFERLVGLAREVAAAHPGHPARLLFQYVVSETAAIEYVLSRGCTRSAGIYRMVRDLSLPIPDRPLPGPLVSRAWRMETEAEQAAYVAAHNECFPATPLALDPWQYFLSSPAWAAGGAAFTAFDGAEDGAEHSAERGGVRNGEDRAERAGEQGGEGGPAGRGEIAGSVAAYFEEAASRERGCKVGATEHIFVRAAWRRRGVAGHLICRALAYLRDQGMDEAILEVLAENRSALSLYEGLGYRVVQESALYARDVEGEF